MQTSTGCHSPSVQQEVDVTAYLSSIAHFPFCVILPIYDMMSVLACKCKTTTKSPCGTLLCSCHRNGMPCMVACKHCSGEECDNVHQLNMDEDDELQYVMLDDDWADEEVID